MEVYLFYVTRNDFQVSKLSLASSESFWLREPRAKRKDYVRDLVVPKNPATSASQAKLDGSRSHAQSAKEQTKA